MLACLGSIDAESNAANGRSDLLDEVALELLIEVKLGYNGFARIGLAQAHESPPDMEVKTLVGKVHSLVLTEEKSDEIRAVRNQQMATGDLFPAEENIKHQGFVVHLVFVRGSRRVTSDSPIYTDFPNIL